MASRLISAVSGLAWLGISQYADAKSCYMMCILITVVSIAVCAWMNTVVEFYIVVVTMTVASAGSFIYGKVLMAYLTPKHKVSDFTFPLFLHLIERICEDMRAVNTLIQHQHSGLQPDLTRRARRCRTTSASWG